MCFVFFLFGRRFTQDEQQLRWMCHCMSKCICLEHKLVVFCGRTNCSNHSIFEGISTPKKNNKHTQYQVVHTHFVCFQTWPPDVWIMIYEHRKVVLIKSTLVCFRFFSLVVFYNNKTRNFNPIPPIEKICFDFIVTFVLWLGDNTHQAIPFQATGLSVCTNLRTKHD